MSRIQDPSLHDEGRKPSSQMLPARGATGGSGGSAAAAVTPNAAATCTAAAASPGAASAADPDPVAVTGVTVAIVPA